MLGNQDLQDGLSNDKKELNKRASVQDATVAHSKNTFANDVQNAVKEGRLT